jgi:chorismate mutase
MAVRGIRGATSVEKNDRQEILTRTRELLEEMVKRNGVDIDDIASVIFSATEDLNDVFPAVAAREMGWTCIPLFGCQEMRVKGSLSGVVRILMHVNSGKKQSEMAHPYLHRARELRPDLEGGAGTGGES